MFEDIPSILICVTPPEGKQQSRRLSVPLVKQTEIIPKNRRSSVPDAFKEKKRTSLTDTIKKKWKHLHGQSQSQSQEHSIDPLWASEMQREIRIMTKIAKGQYRNSKRNSLTQLTQLTLTKE